MISEHAEQSSAFFLWSLNINEQTILCCR